MYNHVTSAFFLPTDRHTAYMVIKITEVRKSQALSVP